jgi:hypothetical protein
MKKLVLKCHALQPSSSGHELHSSRSIAEWTRFFTLVQCFCGPPRYGRSRCFATKRSNACELLRVVGVGKRQASIAYEAGPAAADDAPPTAEAVTSCQRVSRYD